MRHTGCKALLAAALTSAVVFGTPQAQAASYQFSCIPSINSVADCNAATQQILMDVTSTGVNQVAFKFSNTGTVASGIEGVYFDDGTLLGISYLIDKDENGGLAGVDFTAGSASPPNLPRGQNLEPDFEVTAGFLADSDPPVAKNGIDPGEWLTIVFNLQSGGTYQDVIDELGDGSLRVGLHVVGFESGGSESMINQMTPVPVPPALVFMASGLLGLLGLRRKG